MRQAPHEVPFGDLSRSYRRVRPEVDDAIAGVLERGWFVLGEKLACFEREFASFCEVEYAVGVGNGTDALTLALRAVGVGPGDEVITTPLSAAFTALAISQIGAEVVFADIDRERYTLDPDAVEAAITARTKAVLPVHLYGQPAEMDRLSEVARSHSLALVEDASQAHGARYRGRRAGGLADAAAFSFYPSKNLGAFGDAGAVTTNSAELAEEVRILRDGGQSRRYEHVVRGVNSRLDELQAAVLSIRLRSLDDDNVRRRTIAARYTAAIGAGSGCRAPFVAVDVESVFHLYVVRSANRDQLMRRLGEAGVSTAVHYPTPIHLQPAYGGTSRTGEYPEAESAAREVLSIPLYPELTDDEVELVAGALVG